MQRWHIHFLGCRELPHDLTAFERRHFFTFSEGETAAILSRRGTQLQLGAALQLGFMKLSGRPLDSVDRVSVALLEHLGDTLGIQVPHLASLKTLYRRRPTMFAHQKWARDFLGFKEFTTRRQGVLVTYLRDQAQHRETTDELVADANVWLYERQVLIPGSRRVADLARTALLGVAGEHAKAVRAEISNETLVRWERSLVRKYSGRSRLEWLQERPRRLSKKGMRELLEKIKFLRGIGAHRFPLQAIRLDRQRAYSRAARKRRPARLLELPDDARAVTVACFVRISLLELTDAALGQFEMRASRLVGQAEQTAQTLQQELAIDARACLQKIRRLVDDTSVADSDLRLRIRAEYPEQEDRLDSQAAEARKALSEDGRRVRPLLKEIAAMSLEHASYTPAGQALRILRRQYKAGKSTLPKDSKSEFPAMWDELINSDDRRQALRGYEAATLQELRQSLKRGTIWSNDSLKYSEHETSLIPPDDWSKKRDRYIRNLGAHSKAKNTVERLEAGIEAGLAAVAKAVETDELRIRGDELRLPAIAAEEYPDTHVQTELFAKLGGSDLPGIIVDVDSQVRFSWTLLGRPPTSDKELVALYAAVLAHGTDLSLAAVERLVPGVSRNSVGQIMKTLEGGSRLQRANSAVVEFLRGQPIAETWGDGTTASSDAMSLEASRHLWNARVDPRRRTHSIGMYTHVLDQWGIVYDQPLVLNQRQVGAAIEGVVRSTSAPSIESLAVDTHGYTDFGMAIAKLLGFDLCPRLRNLTHRRLYVARGTKAPESIRDICRPVVATRHIIDQWDNLLRLAASIREGHVSAVDALERYGSAARGDELHRAGVALGRLQRTLFLCDYFTNESFRRELLRILNHGESVHTLQRAIHRGGVGVRRERHMGELWATSGSLALLTNIVMAWVTLSMQGILDAWGKKGRTLSSSELNALKHTSPLHFEGINFRGVMHFPVDRHARRLFHGELVAVA